MGAKCRRSGERLQWPQPAGGREGGVSEGSEHVAWAGIGSGRMAGEEGSSQQGARVPGLCRWLAGWLAACWDPGSLGEDWPGMEDSTLVGLGPNYCSITLQP